MESAFGLLFVVMIIASIWGGIVLALKWAKQPVARVFLSLLLIAVFIVASIVAVIAGCTAVVGPPNFH